jgi:hypothetical protein
LDAANGTNCFFFATLGIPSKLRVSFTPRSSSSHIALRRFFIVDRLSMLGVFLNPRNGWRLLDDVLALVRLLSIFTGASIVGPLPTGRRSRLLGRRDFSVDDNPSMLRVFLTPRTGWRLLDDVLALVRSLSIVRPLTIFTGASIVGPLPTGRRSRLLGRRGFFVEDNPSMLRVFLTPRTGWRLLDDVLALVRLFFRLTFQRISTDGGRNPSMLRVFLTPRTGSRLLDDVLALVRLFFRLRFSFQRISTDGGRNPSMLRVFLTLRTGSRLLDDVTGSRLLDAVLALVRLFFRLRFSFHDVLAVIRPLSIFTGASIGGPLPTGRRSRLFGLPPIGMLFLRATPPPFRPAIFTGASILGPLFSPAKV